MKRINIVIVLLFLVMPGFAQIDVYDNTSNPVFAFTVDSTVKINDTMRFVRVYLPQNISMQKDQASIVVANKRARGDMDISFRGNVEISVIGRGKFKLNLADYAYFLVHLNSRDSAPQKNDLLYTYYFYPPKFYGRVYNLTRNAIYLKRSTGDSAYNFKSAIFLDEKAENELLKTLVNDIHTVAATMKKQDGGKDQLIKSGIFNGKKLFTAMGTATIDDLAKFLDYMLSRPTLYAAAAWNISGIFASWVTSGTPIAKKN